MSWFKEQLLFSRIEILGLLGIIGIGMLGIIIQFIPDHKGEDYELQLSDIMIEEEVKAFLEKPKKSYKQKKTNNNQFKKPKTAYKKPKVTRHVFDFDPNTVTEDSLVMLGFKNYLAERWVKYRSKGKRFMDLDDVLSVYGIDTSLVEKISEHFLFPEKQQFHSEEKKQFQYKDENKQEYNAMTGQADAYDWTKEKALDPYKVKVKKDLPVFDINSSTKEELMQINGIGPKYASRIIKYRSILGGYSNKDQLRQVYGMTDSTFTLIKDQIAVLSPPDKIRINIVSQKQLAKHYLLSYKMAKLIYVFREEHGAFVDEEDFKAIKGIEAEEIEKIIPYLDFAL